MIYIDLTGKQPDEDWIKKSDELTQRLLNAKTVEERNKVIDTNSQHWRDLRDWLLKQSNGKCWVSEVRESYSYYDVEHFRPKKCARDLDGKERDGYWWLAFDWRNLRLCGNVGNRKKQSFFPLRKGSLCAGSPDKNMDDEEPCFLDPTDARDPGLLAFTEEGLAIPAPGIKGWDQERTEITIDKFKFNGHEPLVEARRKLWQECRLKLDEYHRALEQYHKGHSPTARDRARKVCEEIRGLSRPSEPLSRVVKDCIRLSGDEVLNRLV